MEISKNWNPFYFLGIKSSFFQINLEILKEAIVASTILILFFLFLKFYFFKKDSILKNFFIYIAETFYSLIEETIGYVDKKTFSFTFSLFFILLAYNLLSLIPSFEEPTKDINVAIAFALFGFIKIHKIAYSELGSHYFSHWFKTPFSLNKKKFYFKKNILKYIEFTVKIILNIISAILLFPFELLSRISLVMSLSFRLFGNIFGGSKIVELIGMFSKKSIILNIILTTIGINLLLIGIFGFFEGLMQAFIFTLVALNNVGILLGDEFI